MSFLSHVLLKTDSTIDPPPQKKRQRLSSTNVSWLLDAREDTVEKQKGIHIISCVQRSNDRRPRSACRGTPYFRRFDRDLGYLKPAISLKKSWGGEPTVERL